MKKAALFSCLSDKAQQNTLVLLDKLDSAETKTKEFAKAVDRAQIGQCEEKLGIPLAEFIGITLKAMQDHHEELGF